MRAELKEIQVGSCHSKTHFPHHEDELLLPVNMEFKCYFQVLNVGNTLHYVSAWYQLQHNRYTVNLYREGSEPRSLVKTFPRVQWALASVFQFMPFSTNYKIST